MQNTKTGHLVLAEDNPETAFRKDDVRQRDKNGENYNLAKFNDGCNVRITNNGMICKTAVQDRKFNGPGLRSDAGSWMPIIVKDDGGFFIRINADQPGDAFIRPRRVAAPPSVHQAGDRIVEECREACCHKRRKLQPRLAQPIKYRITGESGEVNQLKMKQTITPIEHPFGRPKMYKDIKAFLSIKNARQLESRMDWSTAVSDELTIRKAVRRNLNFPTLCGPIPSSKLTSFLSNQVISGLCRQLETVYRWASTLDPPLKILPRTTRRNHICWFPACVGMSLVGEVISHRQGGVSDICLPCSFTQACIALSSTMAIKQSNSTNEMGYSTTSMKETHQVECWMSAVQEVVNINSTGVRISATHDNPHKSPPLVGKRAHSIHPALVAVMHEETNATYRLPEPYYAERTQPIVGESAIKVCLKTEPKRWKEDTEESSSSYTLTSSVAIPVSENAESASMQMVYSSQLGDQNVSECGPSEYDSAAGSKDYPSMCGHDRPCDSTLLVRSAPTCLPSTFSVPETPHLIHAAQTIGDLDMCGSKK